MSAVDITQTRLFTYERRQQILKIIELYNRATVDELSLKFGVSTVTIRKDLNWIAGTKPVIRTRGGAVLKIGIL